MTTLKRFALGVWDFIVGDDWATAVGIVLALGATAAIADDNAAAWVVMPVSVLGLLVLSLRRAR